MVNSDNYVCSCGAVTKEEIVEAISKGARTISELMYQVGVCSGCGTCESRVQVIIDVEIYKLKKIELKVLSSR